MPSFKTSLAIAATTFFTFSARAQNTYNINPNSVPLTTRETWCSSQIASCPLLCLQLPGSTSSATLDNTCDPNTLAYDCTCGNGQAPSAADYSQTIPFFECQEYGNQCVAACAPTNATCQTACRVDNPCGAQNPVLASTSSSDMPSTTAASVASSINPSSSPSSGAVITSLGGGVVPTASSSSGSAAKTDSSKSSGGQAALDLGRSYGLAIVLMVLSAGFACAM